MIMKRKKKDGYEVYHKGKESNNGLVSGNDSHDAGNNDNDASKTERSSGLGTNIITLVRRFSKKLVVFSI